MGARDGREAARRHGLLDGHDLELRVHERHVDREAHPERVDRRAARDQQRVTGRRRGQEREPEQARAEAAGLMDHEPAADVMRRKSFESLREHLHP
jgi:hypothetical protein